MDKVEQIIRDMVQSCFACYNDISCNECEQRSLCSHYKFGKNLLTLNYKKESETAKEILLPLIEIETKIDPLKTGIRYKALENLAEKYGVKLTEFTTSTEVKQ